MQGGIAWRLKNNDQELNVISVTPNPSKNEIEFNFTLPQDIEAELIIRDILGKVVKSFKLEPNINRLQTTTQSMTNGIYNYSLATKDSLIGSGKLVVLH